MASYPGALIYLAKRVCAIIFEVDTIQIVQDCPLALTKVK